MRVPKHLDIGPHRYEVRADPDTCRLLRADSARGDTVPDDHVIRLDVDRPSSGVAETLLHEAMHAVWDQALRGLPFDRDQEESVVTNLAPAVMDLLRRNPQLVALLLA